MAPPRLSPLDASFLAVETPSAHMHVAWRGRFAPAPGRPPVTLAALRAQVAGRLDHAARFRQRLAFTPGGIAEPVWVDDTSFDLEYHVASLESAACPAGCGTAWGAEAPITQARFAALCDQVLSQPLDRSRPLWRILLAPALDDGTVGVLMQIHHAMVDGMSAVALALLLLDADPTAPTPTATPRPEWLPQRSPGATRRTIDALAEVGTEPLRLGSRLARLAAGSARPSGSARLGETLRRAALAVGEDVLRAAPASFLNVPIGPQRRLVGQVTELEPLLHVKRKQEVTLNDVVLTIVAGALRRIATDRGGQAKPLKVMVPVSRRDASQFAELGNRISFVFVDLPVHVSRPLSRLAAVHEATTAFKRDGRAAGGELLLDALGLLPTPIQGRAARLVSTPRTYNLVISNVPGPRFPVYLLGARLIEALPVIPLSEGHALAVGCFSLPDHLCVSAYADPEALPSIDRLPEALAESIAELTMNQHSNPLKQAHVKPVARTAQSQTEPA